MGYCNNNPIVGQLSAVCKTLLVHNDMLNIASNNRPPNLYYTKYQTNVMVQFGVIEHFVKIINPSLARSRLKTEIKYRQMIGLNGCVCFPCTA